MTPASSWPRMLAPSKADTELRHRMSVRACGRQEALMLRAMSGPLLQRYDRQPLIVYGRSANTVSA